MNNHARNFWNDVNRAQLVELAASKLAASEIAAILGTSRQSIVVACISRGIPFVICTEAEVADLRAKARIREIRKLEKRKAERRAAGVPARNRKPVTIPGTAQTSVIYRNQLPRIGEMSKNALREIIAQAVRNTAEMAL